MARASVSSRQVLCPLGRPAKRALQWRAQIKNTATGSTKSLRRRSGGGKLRWRRASLTDRERKNDPSDGQRLASHRARTPPACRHRLGCHPAAASMPRIQFEQAVHVCTKVLGLDAESIWFAFKQYGRHPCMARQRLSFVQNGPRILRCHLYWERESSRLWGGGRQPLEQTREVYWLGSVVGASSVASLPRCLLVTRPPCSGIQTRTSTAVATVESNPSLDLSGVCGIPEQVLGADGKQSQEWRSQDGPRRQPAAPRPDKPGDSVSVSHSRPLWMAFGGPNLRHQSLLSSNRWESSFDIGRDTQEDDVLSQGGGLRRRQSQPRRRPHPEVPLPRTGSLRSDAGSLLAWRKTKVVLVKVVS